MIGVILVHAHDNLTVLGTPQRLRLALALQRAGATKVLAVAVDSASQLHVDALCVSADNDSRSRSRVASKSAWPEGGALVVSDRVLMDTRALSSLRDAGPGHSVRVGDRVVAAYTEREGFSLDGLSLTEIAPHGVCVPFASASDLPAAARALIDSLRKPQDGWVSRAINRNLSLAISTRLVHTNIHPNVLSVAILFLGVLGAWIALGGDWASLAIGGVLFQAQSVLDGCDGEIARLSFRGSRAGEWLDTIGDDITNYSFFAAAGWGLSNAGYSIAGWAALWGVLVGVLASGIEYRYLIRIGSGDLLKYPLGFGNDPEPVKESGGESGGVARVLGAIRPAFKRDFFVFATMLAAFGGPWPLTVMTVLFAAGATATCGAVVASEVRRGGRLQS